MSYKVEVIADGSGKWVSNSLRFRTKKDAEAYASDLYSRWTAVREKRVKRCREPFNSVWDDQAWRAKSLEEAGT